MNTLADAWKWYLTTCRNLDLWQRLGKKHWENISRETAIGQDNKFRNLLASDIEADTTISVAPIDGLAVIVMFSVFEATVRSHVVARIEPEAGSLSDPILKQAADDAIEGVELGSFYRRVLEPLKKQGRVSADLVTQVDQVRDYRNWVAHGRRERPKNNIDPKEAYKRLGMFLDVLGIAVESEQREAKRPDKEPGSEH